MHKYDTRRIRREVQFLYDVWAEQQRGPITPRQQQQQERIATKEVCSTIPNDNSRWFLAGCERYRQSLIDVPTAHEEAAGRGFQTAHANVKKGFLTSMRKNDQL